MESSGEPWVRCIEDGPASWRSGYEAREGRTAKKLKVEIRAPPLGMQTSASWNKGLLCLLSHLCAATSFHCTPTLRAK
uniref:Uncharacterized protein n=1 Tax=Aegilops tauschii TaxID=37682 RepID=M8C3D0_AEGTA